MNAAHYLQNNIVAPCPFHLGDAVPEVPLLTMDLQETSLHAHLQASERPTIVLVGSHT